MVFKLLLLTLVEEGKCKVSKITKAGLYLDKQMSLLCLHRYMSLPNLQPSLKMCLFETGKDLENEQQQQKGMS